MEKKNLDAAKEAWGGIGGSGKHSPAMLAELVKDPAFEQLLKGPQKSWGGIGGTGNHPENLEPEAKK